MNEAVKSKKLDIVLYTRSPAMFEVNACYAYWLSHNPKFGHVYVLPTYVDHAVARNLGYAMHGPDAFSNTPENKRPIKAFLGYDMKEVFAALPADAAPASQKSTDILAFTKKALNAYAAKATHTPEEKQLLTEMRLDGYDKSAAYKRKLRPLTFETLNQCSISAYDYEIAWTKNFEACLPTPTPANRAEQLIEHSSKGFLPELAKQVDAGEQQSKRAFPRCSNVSTEADVKAFMDAHQFKKIVLKEHHSNQGLGIYKIEMREDGSLQASRKSKPIELSSVLSKSPLLAMEWLEPQKGDIRVIAVGGKILGGYKRVPKKGSELANYAQGGSAADYELTAEDRRIVDRTLQALGDKGYHWVGVDLLANAEGRRFVSEVNIGFSGGLEEIHDFELKNRPKTPNAGERFAQAMAELGQNRSRALGAA